MGDDIKIAVGALSTSAYSPLTLGLGWPEVGRLLFLVGCSTIGTIMNGFFISTFFVESRLRKAGNVFLACAGLSDLFLTSIVMPACAVVLLSREWDVEPVCSVLQFIAEFATYSYNVFFMMTAVENFFRYCCSEKKYKFFKSNKVGILAVAIFAISIVTAAAGIFLQLDYNYCTRAHFGNVYFRIVTAVLFQGVPFVITMVSLIIVSVQLRRKARSHVYYKRSHQFDSDYWATIINIFSYALFVIAWIPYIVVVNEYPESCDERYYVTAWIGLTRSVMSTVLFACFNSRFRHAYADLFNYCCCKNTLTYSSRQRRVLQGRPTISDVRVHIMHQAIAANSPPRFSSSMRETQDL